MVHNDFRVVFLQYAISALPVDLQPFGVLYGHFDEGNILAPPRKI